MAITLAILISPAEAQTLVWSQAIGGSTYTCNIDANKSPYPDCLNSMAKICSTTDSWDSTKKANCQTGVNTMFGGMNSLWQAVRKECGKWTWTQNGISYTGAYPSTNCNFANSNLIAYGYYTQLDGSIVPVTTALTSSIKARLWSFLSDSTAATSSAATNTAATSTSATSTATTTCTSSSSECCWVIRSWQKMGKSTTVSSTNATACCYVLGSTTQTSGIPGVKCTSTGIVTEIRWYYQSLQGQIPPELSNLVNLARL
jgi:hypothetical protein